MREIQVMPSLESCAQLYYPSGSYFVPDAHAIFDLPCLKLVVSKVLGYGIVAGSAMVKLPQVAKIARAGNVDGLSSSSIALELTATIASFSYFAPLGYAFSTWGCARRSPILRVCTNRAPSAACLRAACVRAALM